MFPTDLEAHLRSGVTTLCRCWAVTRKDGAQYGFTDHDGDLLFDGVTFRADTGLAAGAIAQGSGLSVDNTEAIGALSDVALREEDLRAGRFDGAEVQAWLVNWADVAQRVLQFRGTIGEITRANGAFTAELRGLTELLNTPRGRMFQAPCGAVLGDGACGVDLTQPDFRFEGAVEGFEDRKLFHFANMAGYADRWFEGGRLTVISGAAQGLVGHVKNDRLSGTARRIELWESLGVDVVAGDTVRFTAGCDKRAGTCKSKFGNFVNFQGFPHIPGEDWLMAYPRDGQVMQGGSLNQ